MTSLILLKLAASIFGFSLVIVIANFVAMLSEMKNRDTPHWWMLAIHLVFGAVASVSALTAVIAGIVWLVKNLPA
jgi:hypothetical protein